MNYDFLAGEIFMAVFLLTLYRYKTKPYSGKPCKEYKEKGFCKHQINH